MPEPFIIGGVGLAGLLLKRNFSSPISLPGAKNGGLIWPPLTKLIEDSSALSENKLKADVERATQQANAPRGAGRLGFEMQGWERNQGLRTKGLSDAFLTIIIPRVKREYS